MHAGSDIVEAFTYYAHREKLRIVEKEQLLEQMNRGALEIAKGVAQEPGALFAGDICLAYHDEEWGVPMKAFAGRDVEQRPLSESCACER